MDLNVYYKQKRRKAAVFKLAAFFLILSLAASAVFGLIRVFKAYNIQQVLTAYSFGLSKLPEAQVAAAPWLIFCPRYAEGFGEASLPARCSYVDTNGILSESAPYFSENPLPELIMDGLWDIKIGDRMVENGMIQFLNIFFGALKSIEAAPWRVAIANKDIKITLKEGWHILLSLNVPAEESAANLKLLLDKKIGKQRSKLEYIDLRFLDKAFYKLR
ncbi:hypothetical protein A3G55_03385 [Candidatus Giovannonibacteria bacterium RIFCSPLOWO2_12_FULL_44_25]|uniref:POTRA domain-containing protein n=2 Tax=Candidatus Giovannoniibacteriota TaxID=1752738 RepID=A0A1F5W7H8_9BACT|nr:MAG: hypothetical protein UW53_C0004G0076 [Candidatus Giovannonibacteria bacterium GW2011_GWA1_44_25]KKU30182.1 MAG: hypothetical protein UX43_C0002G0076 [Candidatus Giovannonibacteria bacterium GW2011_GWB1_46_20]OGF49765.1 MAG: hypothetical protein A2120_00460 [Candidatus Giovannonibacteria bacterium GWA2_45_15]OGF59474.1 MAG: hypothetical protein A2W40_03570 [Candidatus Giovannonibacteria bacterium RIFCSPHIGHO2_01_45_12]OGF61268.1 MAG: hypothetical protein A2656_04820 [Candidatus Giovannon